MVKLNLNLDAPSFDDSEYCAKCESILEWAETRPDFDSYFVEKMRDVVEEGTKPLTQKQKDAIDNIIEKFGIEY